MGLILANTEVTSIPDASKVVAIRSPKRPRELYYYPGSNKNTGRRDFKPQGIVIHWTGGESPPVRLPGTHWSMVDQLDKSNLSVDFAIDSSIGGPERRRIVQLADPVGTRTAHAGIANLRFLGIEMVSRGLPTAADVAAEPDLEARLELDWEVARDLYHDGINGRTFGLLSFDPAAMHDMLWLVETLCGLLDIPRRIPWQRLTDGELMRMEKDSVAQRMLATTKPVRFDSSWWLPLFDRDTARWGRAAEFSGVMGHFHTHESRRDPGTQPFYALWREGFNPTGKPLR